MEWIKDLFKKKLKTHYRMCAMCCNCATTYIFKISLGESMDQFLKDRRCSNCGVEDRFINVAG